MRTCTKITLSCEALKQFRGRTIVLVWSFSKMKNPWKICETFHVNNFNRYSNTTYFVKSSRGIQRYVFCISTKI